MGQKAFEDAPSFSEAYAQVAKVRAQYKESTGAF